MTKFRAGLLLGLAAGYYLGAKAGRRRYDQINRGLAAVRKSAPLDHARTAIGRAKAVVSLGRERVHVDLTEPPSPKTYVAH